MKDGDVDPHREGSFGGPLRPERGRSRQAHANKLCEGDHNLRPGGKVAQTAAVASQAAATTSASGIATGESGTIGVYSAAVALSLMEATHAQLVAVTAQIK